MVVLVPRIRPINVRLSEEEYLELERFCVASGARSISDLVRGAMHNVVASGNQNNSLVASVKEYSAQVRDLELTVKELAAELASLRAGVRPLTAEESVTKDETTVTQLIVDAKDSPDSTDGGATTVPDGSLAPGQRAKA
jgi:phage shock protein A